MREVFFGDGEEKKKGGKNGFFGGARQGEKGGF